MYEVTMNPPLVGYYIAGVAALFGRSEVALHTAFLLPAAGAVVGTYWLARRLSGRPLEAGLAALLSPVFLVSPWSAHSSEGDQPFQAKATTCSS